jgi:hypothetical protein
MEQLLNNLCTYLLLINSNMNSGACQAALKATYIQSGANNIYNLGQDYYSKKGEAIVRDNINQNIIYGTIGLYAIDDAFNKKEIKASVKCGIKLCDTLNFDLTSSAQSYNMGWKWEF